MAFLSTRDWLGSKIVAFFTIVVSSEVSCGLREVAASLHSVISGPCSWIELHLSVKFVHALVCSSDVVVQISIVDYLLPLFIPMRDIFREKELQI